jgi:hypothetical protein
LALLGASRRIESQHLCGVPAIVLTMKEDVLEQVVDDYLKFNGYFTTHNVAFRPCPERNDYVATQGLGPVRRRRRRFSS